MQTLHFMQTGFVISNDKPGFLEQVEKKTIKLSSAEFAQRVVMVKRPQ